MNTESFVPPIEGEGDEERVLTPEEIAKKIDELTATIKELKEQSKSSKENIDAPLGSDEYVDFGFMAQARELEMEVENLQTALIQMGNEGDADAIKAAQGDLF